MQPIILKKNLKKDLCVIVGGLAFAAVAYFIVAYGEREMDKYVGWIGMLFFGVGAIFMLLIDLKTLNKPQAIITDDAISIYSVKGYKDIRFSEIKYYAVIDDAVLSFYAEEPKSVFSRAIGGLTLKNLNMPKAEIICVMTEILDKHGAKALEQG